MLPETTCLEKEKMSLKLKPGPKLVLGDWEYDDLVDVDERVDHDVTEVAHRYLFLPVTLAADVTLRDIFLLLDADPVLQQVFARDFAKELLEEVMCGPAIQPPPITYDPNSIEYLELFQTWGRNSVTRVIEPIHRLDFHGVGFELREDFAPDDIFVYQAGDRIDWGISFESPLNLLHFPVCINPEVVVFEANEDSVDYGNQIWSVVNPGVTLGQVIHSILWELSFHGGGESREEDRARLLAAKEEVMTGVAITHRFFDLFSEEKEVLASCFADMGGHAHAALYDALVKMGDHDNANEIFQKSFGGIQLKPEFLNMTGIELRAFVRQHGV